MNVRELIKELSKLDPDKMVVVSGYEGGYNEVNQVNQVQLRLNVNTVWYYGRHDDDENSKDAAIYLS